MNFVYLFRRARQMPVHVAIYRAFRMFFREGVSAVSKWRARNTCSYIDADLLSELQTIKPLGISAIRDIARIDSDLLANVAFRNANHEFDLLGSGWVKVSLGADFFGFAGGKYPAEPENAIPIHRRVTRPNRQYARKLNCLIQQPYEPIEWLADFRSGYRWRADTYYTDLTIGKPYASDIKLPWELGRLQHLPRMAAIVLSDLGARSFLVSEIKNQIFDFLASNPPEFGPNWGCPMDVGIRASNLSITYSILAAGNIDFGGPFGRELAAALLSHGRFIFQNLEWSESRRSNHYLCDVAGLVFIGASLTPTPETIMWLSFGIFEICKEFKNQFQSDGSNYEGSTNYHRLSLEVCVYALAVAGGLSEDMISAMEETPFTIPVSCRVSLPGNLGQEAASLVRSFPAEITQKLLNAREFLEAVSIQNGDLVQIGDTDSGRFVVLDIVLKQETDSANELRENPINVNATLSALNALLGRETPGSLSSAVVSHLLNGKHPFLELQHEPRTYLPVSYGDECLGGDEKFTHRYEFSLPHLEVMKIQQNYFPDFGLVVWRCDNFHMTFRVARHERSDAPFGHTHDDNLGVTLWSNGEWIIEDPGTFVYTSVPELRRRYQRAEAHFVPRATNWSFVSYPSEYLFDCNHDATVTSLKIQGAMASASVKFGKKLVAREVVVSDGRVVISDYAIGCALLKRSTLVGAARGYGHQPLPDIAYPAERQSANFMRDEK